MGEIVRPNWLINVQTETTNPMHLIVNEKIYTYTLVKPKLEPRLPYTVGGHIADNSLFISSDVPDDFRRYILEHEIYHDTTLINMPPEEACVAALKLELEEAKKTLGDRFSLYLYGKQKIDEFAGRIEFFNALVALYKDPKQANARDSAFVEGINKACEYLKVLNL